MKKVEINLNDASGGLNDRDHPATIPQNQFSKLENINTDEGGWPGKKRFGKEIIQYAPIDPQLCVVDGNTMGYWNLDQAVPPLTDPINGNSFDFPVASPTTIPTQTAGLLPTSGPLGYNFGQKVPWNFDDRMEANWGAYLDGKSACTFEAWVKFDEDFTGDVLFYDPPLSGPYVAHSNSGAAVIATYNKQPLSFDPQAIANGIRAWRDFDTSSGNHIGGPYFTFKIQTNGIPDTVTTLTSAKQQTNIWLHVRGTYDSATTKAQLFVNGTLEDEKVVLGGGTINEATAIEPGFTSFGPIDKVLLGFGHAGNNGPQHTYHQFKGIIDDVCISDVARTTVPYKEPRGKPWSFRKSDGSAQIIVSAGDGLYFTVGDGEWQSIKNGLSDSAYWDAVQIKDAIYLQNGIDDPLVWDGVSIFPWGEPPVPVTVTEIAGSIPNDATGHKYVVTFLFGNEEGGPGTEAIHKVLSGPSDLELTNIPIGPPGCTGRKIYRNKDTASQTPFYLVREIADNTTTSMLLSYINNGSPQTDGGADGVLDAILGTGAYVEMKADVLFTKIPKGKYTLAIHNRAWVTNENDPYALYYSELNQPNIFRAPNFVRASEDKGVIVGMAKYYGEIHVSKGGESTLILRGDNPSNWQQFEILHPTLGAIDHWSFAHRTTPQSDSYRLCFMSEDGIYEYAGRDYKKVSDSINGTFLNLAQNNSQRRDAVWTDPIDFQNVTPHGGGSDNVYQPLYSTDGSRQEPGTIGMIDQLEHIGLPKTLVSGVPFVGNIIATENDPALEGNILFSTDNDSNVYRTTDNFKTASIETTVTAGHKVVQILYADVGPGTPTFFLFTDDDGSGGGGKLFDWVPGTATLTDNGNANGGFFWEMDCPWSAEGTPTDDGFGGVEDARGFIAGENQSNWNIYLTHSQKLEANMEFFSFFLGARTFAIHTGATSLSEQNTALVAEALSLTNTAPTADTVGFFGPGFIGTRQDVTPSLPFPTTKNVVITSHYYRREFPAWKGMQTVGGVSVPGTITPQGIWDATTQKLFFVAGHPADARGNRPARIYEWDGSTFTTRVTDTTCIAMSVGILQFPSLLNQNTLIYTKPAFDAKPYGRSITDVNNGFVTNVYGQLASGGPEVFLGTIPAADTHTQYDRNRLPTKITLNNLNPYRHIIFSGIDYSNGYAHNLVDAYGNNVGLGAGRYDGYSWHGRIFATQIDNVALGFQWNPTPDFETRGAFPIDVKVTTETSPFDSYVLMANMQADTFYDQAVFSSVDITKLQPYKTSGFDNYLTTRSNLLYIKDSGSAGNYEWAERLYWNQENTLTSKMVQIGVPGDWEVRGNFEAFAFNTGGFSSFEDFNADLLGDITFELRNAILSGIPVAVYKPVSVNSQIFGFPSPANAFQWKANFKWIYKRNAPTGYPKIEFVRVGIITGQADVPKPVAFHYRGRTYWSVADRGKTENNKIIVFQKNDSWTLYTGHRIKGMNLFLGELVALEDFRLVKLEKGRHDTGLLIKSLARSGYIMNDQSDKALRDMKMNIKSWVNNPSQTTNGNMKVAVLSGETKFNEEWDFPILATTISEPRQVIVNPPVPFPYNYARAFALEVFTSDETSGSLAPAYDQIENMAGAIITLFVSNRRYRITENE